MGHWTLLENGGGGWSLECLLGEYMYKRGSFVWLGVFFKDVTFVTIVGFD